MAEQKKTNEALNVEDALTQSEAFFIKNKKAIIGAVVAVIIIIAGVVMYKNLYADPREEKAQAALFKGQEYFEADAYAQALNGDSIGFAGFVSGRRIQRHKSSQSCKSLYGSLLCTPR